MSASMAEVLAEHMPTTSSMSSNRGEGGGSHGRSCSCGVSVTVEYAELERRIARAIFEMRRDQGDGITNLPKYLHILEDQPKEN